MVDAKNEYREINKGKMSAGWRKIDFDYISDWAVAVGDFNRQAVPTSGSLSLPTAQ
jgi:hypothetical protein